MKDGGIGTRDTEVLVKDWPASCTAFYTHWLAQRDGELMPTAARSLDDMLARLAPHIYIIDVTENESLVRFQGTALVAGWGVDITGKDVCVFRSKKLRQSVLTLMKEITRQPCGYYCRSVYTSATGRTVVAYIIRLPLSVKPGRPPRVINYKHESETLEPGDTSWVNYKTTHQDWIDIGAGTPTLPPVELVE